MLLLTEADHGPKATCPESDARMLNCVEKRMRATTPSGTDAASSGNGHAMSRPGGMLS